MTKIINQIRNKPWKYLFDSKVMSIFINNIFHIINITKRNSFFYTKNNVTSLTKEYNKYQKSPNEKILLTSSMLNKKPLTQYKEIIYYNTVDANSVEHLNLITVSVLKVFRLEEKFLCEYSQSSRFRKSKK